MSYYSLIAKALTSKQGFLDELWTALSTIGWTLVDGNFTALTMAYTAVSVANDTFTTAGTVPADGTPCQITTSGTVPTGLAINTLYYIVSRTDTTFKLSTTYNGAAINITAQGTGNHTISEAFRVYKSNGENSDKIYQYVRFIYHISTTIIYVYPSYGYNSTTKTATGALVSLANIAAYAGAVTINTTGYTLWIHGNKDIVSLETKLSTAYADIIFGFAKHWLSLKTALTASASSGSSVTITVTSTAGFEVDGQYQIVGNEGEGRDTVIVSSITSTTQMVITSLPRNYASGAVIGDAPCVFGTTTAGIDQVFKQTCPGSVVGLDDCTIYASAWTSQDILFTNTHTDPDRRSERWILRPIYYSSEYANAYSTHGIGFYFDGILQSFASGPAAEDTLTITKLSGGISSGSNNSTTFNDTSKSWTTNFFANKVVVITFGTGIGQIKKIASNTGTALTLASGYTFAVVPDATSQYVICEKAYRCFPHQYCNASKQEGL